MQQHSNKQKARTPPMGATQKRSNKKACMRQGKSWPRHGVHLRYPLAVHPLDHVHPASSSARAKLQRRIAKGAKGFLGGLSVAGPSAQATATLSPPLAPRRATYIVVYNLTIILHCRVSLTAALVLYHPKTPKI